MVHTMVSAKMVKNRFFFVSTSSKITRNNTQKSIDGSIAGLEDVVIVDDDDKVYWDVAEQLAGELDQSPEGALDEEGSVLEFSGPTIDALTVPERLSLCEALASLGLAGIVPPDAATGARRASWSKRAPRRSASWWSRRRPRARSTPSSRDPRSPQLSRAP